MQDAGYCKEPQTLVASLIIAFTRPWYRRLPGIPFGASKAATLSASLRTLARSFFILVFVLVFVTSVLSQKSVRSKS